MQTGVNKSDIKIKGNKLLVNGSVIGLVKDSVFSLSNFGTNSSPASVSDSISEVSAAAG